MGEIESPCWILLDTPVQCPHACRTRALGVGVVGQLQTSTAEAVLGLEDGLFADCHLDGLVVGAVEPRVGHIGKQQDLRPRNGAGSDVVRVEQARRGRVKVGQLRCCRYLPRQHDRAADGGSGRWSRGGEGRQEAADCELRDHRELIKARRRDTMRVDAVYRLNE